MLLRAASRGSRAAPCEGRAMSGVRNFEGARTQKGKHARPYMRVRMNSSCSVKSVYS